MTTAAFPQDYHFFALTVDVDWAPDYMIDYMADAYTTAGVKCTWFLTHASPAVDRLRNNPLFELGIHPNFLEGSSHGKTEDEVIRHCLDLAPGATSVRMHALHQNSRIMWKLRHDYNIKVDCSLYLPRTPHLIPHTLCHSAADVPLVRIPFFWEDDVECLRKDKSWDIANPALHTHGMKMFNFHPVYVGLNEDDFTRYESVKRELCVGRQLSTLTREELQPYTSDEAGVNTIFTRLLNHIRENNLPTFNATEIAEYYLKTL